jgi:hypothetical protein
MEELMRAMGGDGGSLRRWQRGGDPFGGDSASEAWFARVEQQRAGGALRRPGRGGVDDGEDGLRGTEWQPPRRRWEEEDERGGGGGGGGSGPGGPRRPPPMKGDDFRRGMGL